MKSAKQIVVTKNDGTLERFSLTKLTSCLAAVMRGQAYDARLGSPLAKAVLMHLREWRGLKPPSTEYIYRCVCSVLEQTGLGDVAEDLAAHRRLRNARRHRTQVVDATGSDARGESWRKGALVGTLQSRYGLRHGVARFLAGQIEAQVFALGYRVVSRAFLAELVRNEVAAWGLADAPQAGTCVPAAEIAAAARRPEEEE